jgi:phosphatidylglycerophosphatase A
MSSLPSEKPTRKKIDWNQVSGPRAWLAVLSGTYLGAGLLPKMPGTWGTLAALPLAWAVAPEALEIKLTLWMGLLALGTWASAAFYDLFGVADNQCIVIDEVVGVGLTCLLLDRQAGWLWIAAFLAFRFFDIVKLPPVRAVDRWSKGSPGAPMNRWIAGFGVMADDVVAGVQGWIVIYLLLEFLP